MAELVDEWPRQAEKIKLKPDKKTEKKREKNLRCEPRKEEPARPHN